MKNNYQYITSKDNEKIKLFKSLENKKNRYQNRLFVIEGIKPVLEAFDSNIKINNLIFSKEILEKTNNGNKIIDKIDSLDINVIETTPKIIEYLSDTITSQGIIAIMEMPKLEIKGILTNKNILKEKILILDRIQDAGNMGTIIRTADAFDVNNIICIKGTVDPYMPKVVRSTMGSILRINIITIEEEEIANTILELKKLKFRICTTALNNSQDLRKIKLTKNDVIVIGNEANGVSNEILDISDKSIKIPISKNTESLNASVATSIILYNQYINEEE